MCGACWNADVMEDKLRKGDTSCTGLDMEILTLDKLKTLLTEEWVETEQYSFRVYKKAVPEAIQNTISWVATHPTISSKKQTVIVELL